MTTGVVFEVYESTWQAGLFPKPPGLEGVEAEHWQAWRAGWDASIVEGERRCKRALLAGETLTQGGTSRFALHYPASMHWAEHLRADRQAFADHLAAHLANRYRAWGAQVRILRPV